MDRVIDFWENLDIDVGEDKSLTSGWLIALPQDPAMRDVTLSMTTTEVLCSLYLKSQELRDELMKRQALARLRDWLVNPRCSYDEVLDCAKYSYETAARLPTDQQFVMSPLKRICLSALVRHAADMSFGNEEALDAMLIVNRNLRRDYLRALSIEKYVLRPVFFQNKGLKRKVDNGISGMEE